MSEYVCKYQKFIYICNQLQQRKTHKKKRKLWILLNLKRVNVIT